MAVVNTELRKQMAALRKVTLREKHRTEPAREDLREILRGGGWEAKEEAPADDDCDGELHDVSLICGLKVKPGSEAAQYLPANLHSRLRQIAQLAVDIGPETALRLLRIGEEVENMKKRRSR